MEQWLPAGPPRFAVCVSHGAAEHITRYARVAGWFAERGGMDLMPEQETRPVNKYLPPRPRRDGRDASFRGIGILHGSDARHAHGQGKFVCVDRDGLRATYG